MKTQNTSSKKGIVLLLPMVGLMLSQCARCPPLSRGEMPSFTGCWLTEYSQPHSDTTKPDIIFREVPVEITVNKDETIEGTWWSFPVETGEAPHVGRLTGKVKADSLVGDHFPNGTWMGGMGFRLFPSGLTFTGDYEGKGATGISRRFFWNGVKVGNCKCPEKLTRNPEARVARQIK